MWDQVHQRDAVPRRPVGGSPPAAPEGRAYPAGKPLSAAEMKLVKSHAPRQVEKAICLRANAHGGCHAKACEFLHVSAKGQLHWAVQAFLARYGGRKSNRRIPPEEVDGYVAKLRENAASAADAKRAAGKKDQTPDATGTDPSR